MEQVEEQVEIKKQPKKRGPKVNDNAAYKQPDYNDQQKAYAKQYYATNKEKMLKIMKEKVECDCCQKMITKTNMIAHKKTTKCRKHFSIVIVELEN